VKVICPRCGRPGYLTKVKVYGHSYMRVEHVENGNKKVCYLGRDPGDLRRYIEAALGTSNSPKIIRYAGGDFRIADLLHPRLEALCPSKCTFVEVFGGSGYMSQTVSRQKFTNIVYNDIDDTLTTLYKHVKENPEALAAVLLMLPYSRSYSRIITRLLNECRDLAYLAAAAMTFYAINTTYFSKIGKGFAYSIAPAKNEARAYTSRALAVLKYAEAWRDVTIENLDFRDVVKKYDSERTVFYLDPPYVDRAEEYYGRPFTADDLRDMAAMLTQIRGRFLLKLDYNTYKHVSDILSGDRYKVEVFERVLHMKKVRGAPRRKWLLTLVSGPR
jgi:DNA adenine methylase